MPPGGKEYKPEEIRRQQELRNRVAMLREVPLSELGEIFGQEDIVALDAFQKQLGAAQLSRDPFSPEFREKYGDQVEMLGDNTTTYSNDQEDELYEDKILRHLIDSRRDDPDNINIVAAVRIRRSVVAMLLFADAEVVELPKPSEPSNDTSKTNNHPAA